MHDDEFEDSEDHYSDDSCLLHEFTSPSCSRTVSPARSRTVDPGRRTNPCFGASTSNAIPCQTFTRIRPPRTSLGDIEDLSCRLENLKRELRSCNDFRYNSRRRSSSDSRLSAAAAAAPAARNVDLPELSCCACARWDVSLLRALRTDPNSLPERRSDGTSGTRVRQPGRADVGFSPRKGDLIIHHEKMPGRKVLEFYDPVCQRLHDGDILVRFKIDSYACEGLVLVKGSGYVYHRGFWVYLGKDSEQIARSCAW